MKCLGDWPIPILQRWLLSAAAGPVLFLVGLAGCTTLHDPVLLMLSVLLAACMIARCILLYRTIRQGAYETVEGVCIGIKRAAFGNHLRIRLLTDSGAEHSLLLDRYQKLLIGSRYRVYLQHSPVSAPSIAGMQHIALLGLEDLGAYPAGPEASDHKIISTEKPDTIKMEENNEEA